MVSVSAKIDPILSTNLALKVYVSPEARGFTIFSTSKKSITSRELT
jgi:hypothetical protein